MVTRGAGSPRPPGPRPPPKAHFFPAILTVVICYIPLIYIKMSERLENGSTSCVAGCRCKLGRLSVRHQAEEDVSPAGNREDHQADSSEVLHTGSIQLLSAEAWDRYVEVSLRASALSSCKFALPGSLVAKVR